MSNTLHVLALTNTYPTDRAPGDSPQIRDQLQALKAKGVRVDLLYIDRYRGARSYFQAALSILLLSIQHKPYNLIHAYYGHCGFLALLQMRCPVVVTFLGSDLLHPRDSRIGKVAARFAAGIIVQSEEMKRIAGREDAYVIPMGVNLDLFKPCPMVDARRELGLAPDERLVLFPWDPTRRVKRFDIVQKAIQIVQESCDRVRIVQLYGQPHETVAKYMNACDVLVLASDHEGSPMALREAMACNLPIVAVDVGDVRQIIGYTDGCYLCEREPADIAQKVALVLARGNRTCGSQVIRQSDTIWGAERVMSLYGKVLQYSH